MKTKLKSGLTLALALTLNASFAQVNNSDKTTKEPSKIIIIERNKKTDPNRPKMPSRQHIECLYAGGTLSFFFAVPEGECVLTVTDSASGISMQYYFDSADSAEIYVGEIETGSIEISTANGNEYVGLID